MKYGYRGGFTLVELMVIVVITVILVIVGFISYSGYTVNSRDSQRIVHMKQTIEVFQGYALKNKLPLPDNAITITNTGSVIAYQGKLGGSVLDTLEIQDSVRDPKDASSYSYFLTRDRKGFQFMAFMEQDDKELSLLDSIYSSNFSQRYPKTFGSSLGIMAQRDTNTPLEDLSIPGNTLDLENIGGIYELNSYLSESEYVSHNTGALLSLVDLVPKKGKGWRVVDNEFQCFDVNDDGRCPGNLISEGDNSSCYDPINVGQIGDVGVCDGMLIVDNSLINSVASSDVGGTETYSLIGPDTNIYTFGDSSYNIFTGQVTNMSFLFRDDTSFNDDISYWDTSNVENMQYMFAGASSFNQDIGGWEVGKVSTINHMFFGASLFNQDIGGWDTSEIAAMGGAFSQASSFNQDIGGWDTSKVNIMNGMFSQASSFNQDIGGWDTTGVYNITFMFSQASSFNQDLSGWDADAVVLCSGYDSSTPAWVLAKPTLSSCTP